MLLLYHYLVTCHFVMKILVFQIVSNTSFVNFGFFGLVNCYQYLVHFLYFMHLFE